MFSHVTVGIANIDLARQFYNPVFAAIGIEPFVNFGDFSTGYGDRNAAHVWIMKPSDGNPASIGNGDMIAYLAPNRDSVDTAHTRGIENGGSDEGAPGIREMYHPNYYGAYMRDPDGNKLCIVCDNAQ